MHTGKKYEKCFNHNSVRNLLSYIITVFNVGLQGNSSAFATGLGLVCLGWCDSCQWNWCGPTNQTETAWNGGLQRCVVLTSYSMYFGRSSLKPLKHGSQKVNFPSPAFFFVLFLPINIIYDIWGPIPVITNIIHNHLVEYKPRVVDVLSI